MKYSSTAIFFVKCNFFGFPKLLWTKVFRFYAKNIRLCQCSDFFGDICVPSTVQDDSTGCGRCQGIRDDNFILGAITCCDLEFFTINYRGACYVDTVLKVKR